MEHEDNDYNEMNRRTAERIYLAMCEVALIDSIDEQVDKMTEYPDAEMIFEHIKSINRKKSK